MTSDRSPMTGDNLRRVAEAFDLMQEMMLTLFSWEAPDPEKQSKLDVVRGWLDSSEVQDDLRAWADELDRQEATA